MICHSCSCLLFCRHFWGTVYFALLGYSL